MDKQLLIVGAGGFGREVLQYALDVGVSVKGFLDRDAAALKPYGLPFQVLGDETSWRASDDEVFCVAIGEPRIRLAVAEQLDTMGARLFTLVHPTAYVSERATLAPGCIVCPFAFLSTNVHLDRHVIINTYASCGHDARIGVGSNLSPYAVINGGVQLSEGVFMGTHATVTPGKAVGRLSKIAAGAVVTRDVPEKSLAYGNPAVARRYYA